MPVTANVLSKYLNPYFVETGSYLGDGIQAALDAGFEKVISIECFPPNFDSCTRRFKEDDRVYLFQGNSAKHLSALIDSIDDKITFWLDAHYSGAGTGMQETVNPIMEELLQIKRHKRYDHTILIDDRRLFGTNEFLDITESDICGTLFTINSDYIFNFEDGFQPKDILVATP